jgi:hypothetical protein
MVRVLTPHVTKKKKKMKAKNQKPSEENESRE